MIALSTLLMTSKRLRPTTISTYSSIKTSPRHLLSNTVALPLWGLDDTLVGVYGGVGSQEQEVNWNMSQAIIAPVRVVTRRMTISTLLLALAIALYVAFRVFGKI
jgi:hypothetical protein